MNPQERIALLELENVKSLGEKGNTKNKKLKDAIDKKIKRNDSAIEVLQAYSLINPGDRVFNGSRHKIGEVTGKEFQNSLPVININWGTTVTSNSPNTITVVDSEQLIWHWIDIRFTRLHDGIDCNEIKALYKEINILRTQPKTSEPELQKEILLKLDRINKLWEKAIHFHYPEKADFYFEGKRVQIRQHRMCAKHELLFPIITLDKSFKLVHPLKLEPIPLSHICGILDEKRQEPPANNVNGLIIDPEFKKIIPALSTEEREQLERNLLKEGCRDPIVIWKDRNTVIDGHNRYEICTRNKIQFDIAEIDLEDRNSVICWMILNQWGRRNLNPDVMAYLRGQLYNLSKGKHGGDRNSEAMNQHELNRESRAKVQNDPLLLNKESTAEQISKKVGVSPSTIKRDSEFSGITELVADKVGASPFDIINSGCTRTQIKAMRDLPAPIIRKKLEDPNYIDKCELPNLKVDDVVKIKSDRSNKDLVGYQGSLGIVDKIYDHSCDVRIWQRLITGVHLQFLSKVEGDSITLKVSVSPSRLKALMVAYNSIEDAIQTP